jgi:hypothetical protein
MNILTTRRINTFYYVVELFVHFYKSIDYNLMFVLHNFLSCGFDKVLLLNRCILDVVKLLI